MLLNTPRYTGQTPTLKNDMAHDACSAKGEKPRLRRIPGAYAQCCYLQTHGTQNGVGKKWRRTQSGPTQAGLLSGTGSGFTPHPFPPREGEDG